MSIQLDPKNQPNITAILNKILFCDKNKGFVKELEKISSFSTIYKSQNTEESAAVTRIIDKLYNIYTDSVKFINTDGNSLEGEFTLPDSGKDEDSTLETDIEFLEDEEAKLGKKAFSTVIATAKNNLQNYRVENILSKENFDSLVRDLIIASVIRGYHIFIIMSHDTIEDYKSKKQSLHSMFSLKSINAPLDSTKYFNAAKGGLEKKLPANNFTTDTLTIFLHRNTSFVKFIKNIYQMDDDYINTVYPLDPEKQHLYEARGDEEATDIGKQTILPIVDYPILALIQFIKNLLSNTPIPELKIVLKQADNALSKKEALDKRDRQALGDVDDPNSNVSSGDTDQLENIIDYDDYIKIDSNRVLGDIHREYVTSTVRNTLEILCKTEDSAVRSSFEFVAVTPSGSLEKKNLFYDFFDNKFASFAYSPEGAVFVNQLYNGIDNNLPYSVNELKRFLYDLPKNIDEVEVPTKNTSDFIEFVNSHESIKVSYYTFNKVLNNTGDKVSTIKEDFEELFSVDVSSRPFNITLANSLVDTFNIVAQQHKTSTAFASGTVDKNNLITEYIKKVKSYLDAISPDSKIKVGTNASALSSYYYLYPTETNKTDKIRFIFTSKEDFDAKVLAVVSKLESEHEKLVQLSDPNEIATILRNSFSDVFGDSLKGLLRSIPEKASATIANLLLPNEVVINQINNKVTDKTAYRRNMTNETTFLLLGLCSGAESVAPEEETAKPVSGATSAAWTEVKNKKLLFLGILHTRLTFLVAIKEFSDYVEEIVNLFTDSIEQLPKEDKVYLSQSEAMEKDPETTEIINLVSKNISHIISKEGDIHPEYQTRIDTTLKTREDRISKAKRRKELQKLELSDDDI